MRKKREQNETLYFGEIRKTVNMPPGLWQQIEARLRRYEPELTFADWIRRIAQDELKRPPRVLVDLAQPKESPRDQNPKQAPSSHTAALLAALDRAYDRIAIEGLGKRRAVYGNTAQALGRTTGNCRQADPGSTAVLARK